MGHWRTMVGERLNFDVADLDDGQDLVVQIESHRQGVLKGFSNGRKTDERVAMVKYVGFDRPHAYKATLCKSLVSLYGTGDPAKWKGRWVKLYVEMVNDPKVPGSKCEAVRIRPTIPSETEIAAAKLRTATPAPSSPGRDEEEDRRLVTRVCEAIEAAKTPAEVESAITPHRAEILAMDRRSKTLVSSAKAARLATLATLEQVTPPLLEGGSQ